jgi:hypothetical protein
VPHAFHHLERLQADGRPFELVEIGNGLDLVGVDDAARQNDREPFADDDGWNAGGTDEAAFAGGFVGAFAAGAGAAGAWAAAGAANARNVRIRSRFISTSASG